MVQKVTPGEYRKKEKVQRDQVFAVIASDFKI